MQNELHNLTAAGGLDYFMNRLSLVKTQQDTAGLSLPQKQRCQDSAALLCTPPPRGVFSTEALDSSTSSSNASTTLVTPTDERSEFIPRVA